MARSRQRRPRSVVGKAAGSGGEPQPQPDLVSPKPEAAPEPVLQEESPAPEMLAGSALERLKAQRGGGQSPAAARLSTGWDADGQPTDGRYHTC